MTDEVELGHAEAEALALRACRGAGANEASARSLVAATLSAARFGPASVGFPHMVDYLDGFREGRINGDPAPTLTRAFPAHLAGDADRGIAQLGFDLAFTGFVEAARTFGIAVFSQKNSYTTGELGYYVRRLARRGLVGFAVTNANAMVAAKAGAAAVYSTNPLAFGFPLGDDHPPLVIDQSASATAYVNILAAAAEGRTIPEGWAVDANGAETRDPQQAIMGALLPFGGRKGANIALMVEMLSAGFSGGAWSLDAADFNEGTTSPSVGLTVLAMAPEAGRIPRACRQAERLDSLGVHVPGVSGARQRHAASTPFRMPRRTFEAMSRFAEGGEG